MPFPNPDTQFKAGESGNPAGRAKGRRSLSTIIQDMMEAEDFNWDLLPIKSKDFAKKFKTPWEAIVAVAAAQALTGNSKAATWLSKSGYGSKVDITTDGKALPTPIIGLPEYDRNDSSTEDQEPRETD